MRNRVRIANMVVDGVKSAFRVSEHAMAKLPPLGVTFDHIELFQALKQTFLLRFRQWWKPVVIEGVVPEMKICVGETAQQGDRVFN